MNNTTLYTDLLYQNHYRRYIRPIKSRSLLSQLAAELVPVPNPCDTWQQWERFTHQDLVTMPHTALRQEQRRLQLRLLIDPKPPQWLQERLTAIEQALQGGKA